MKALLLLLLLAQAAYAQKAIIIRHGQALSNIEKVFNGSITNSSDFPLTAEGRMQVLRTAQELREKGYGGSKVARVFVSPILRARQTAEGLMEHLGIPNHNKIEEILISETQFGILEKYSHGDLPIGVEPGNHGHGNEFFGENEDDIQMRVSLFLNRLKKYPEVDGIIFIVTHGTPAQQLLNLIHGPAPENSLQNAEYRIVDL